MKGHENKYSKHTISKIISRNCNPKTRQCNRLIIKLNEVIEERNIRNKVKGELLANKKANGWYKEIIVIDGNDSIYKCK